MRHPQHLLVVGLDDPVGLQDLAAAAVAEDEVDVGLVPRRDLCGVPVLGPKARKLVQVHHRSFLRMKHQRLSHRMIGDLRHNQVSHVSTPRQSRSVT